MKKFLIPVALLALVAVLPSGASAQKQLNVDAQGRLDSATRELRTLLNGKDSGIPNEFLKGAECVAVAPRLIKGGFIFAAERARGVTTCRLPNGQWSAPAFFVVTGGSWGPQVGIQSTDLVMLAMNNQGMRHLLADKFQIGASGALAAGPWGRRIAGDTDWRIGSQILTYARARGAYIGVDLRGAWYQQDKSSTLAFYGHPYSPVQLLTGQVTPPGAAQAFLTEVSSSKTEAMGNNKAMTKQEKEQAKRQKRQAQQQTGH